MPSLCPHFLQAMQAANIRLDAGGDISVSAYWERRKKKAPSIPGGDRPNLHFPSSTYSPEASGVSGGNAVGGARHGELCCPAYVSEPLGIRGALSMQITEGYGR